MYLTPLAYRGALRENLSAGSAHLIIRGGRAADGETLSVATTHHTPKFSSDIVGFGIVMASSIRLPSRLFRQRSFAPALLCTSTGMQNVQFSDQTGDHCIFDAILRKSCLCDVGHYGERERMRISCLVEDTDWSLDAGKLGIAMPTLTKSLAAFRMGAAAA